MNQGSPGDWELRTGEPSLPWLLPGNSALTAVLRHHICVCQLNIQIPKRQKMMVDLGSCDYLGG